MFYKAETLKKAIVWEFQFVNGDFEEYDALSSMLIEEAYKLGKQEVSVQLVDQATGPNAKPYNVRISFNDMLERDPHTPFARTRCVKRNDLTKIGSRFHFYKRK